MTARETKAYNIINGLNEASDPEYLGGYIHYMDAINIVCYELFSHAAFETKRFYFSSRTYRKYDKAVYTKEEYAKIINVFKSMEAKGIIKLSKARTTLKPMMTADEWYAAKQERRIQQC